MIETMILAGLIHDEVYARQVLPYLRMDYFTVIGRQVAFKLIRDHITKYQRCPSIEVLQVDLDQQRLKDAPFKQTQAVFAEITSRPEVEKTWLVDQTENHCKRQALYNAIADAAAKLQDRERTDYGEVLDKVQQAIGVSFDSRIGHDYIADAAERFERYQQQAAHYPVRLEMLNRVTGGGFEDKTLTIFMAGPGVGKSLMLCDIAASYLTDGLDVLYITLEMSEDQVSKRIDANLLDINISDLETIGTYGLTKKYNQLTEKPLGRLIIKEYPTAVANAGHFRHLITELATKKKFKPKVLILDYLNIAASSRVTKGGSYEVVKAIAEEFRGLGVENGCLMFTATQLNREGAGMTDFDMTNTAESFGVPMTADYMFGLVSTEQLEAIGQMIVKQIKNRYNDLNSFNKFAIGLDRPHMRLFNLDIQEQAPASKSAPRVVQEDVSNEIDLERFFHA